MFTKQVQNGSRIAVISANDQTGPYSVRLYVNCFYDPHHGWQLGEATTCTAKSKSLQKANAAALQLIGRQERRI